MRLEGKRETHYQVTSNFLLSRGFYDDSIVGKYYLYEFSGHWSILQFKLSTHSNIMSRHQKDSSEGPAVHFQIKLKQAC